jgi:hypothetical protein
MICDETELTNRFDFKYDALIGSFEQYSNYLREGRLQCPTNVPYHLSMLDNNDMMYSDVPLNIPNNASSDTVSTDKTLSNNNMSSTMVDHKIARETSMDMDIPTDNDAHLFEQKISDIVQPLENLENDIQKRKKVRFSSSPSRSIITTRSAAKSSAMTSADNSSPALYINDREISCFVSTTGDPTNMKEVYNSPDRDEWMIAILKEIESWKQSSSYEVVDTYST